MHLPRLVDSLLQDVRAAGSIKDTHFAVLCATFGTPWSTRVVEYLDHADYVTALKVAKDGEAVLKNSRQFVVQDIYHDAKTMATRERAALEFPLKFDTAQSGVYFVNCVPGEINGGFCSCSNFLSSHVQSANALGTESFRFGICPHLLAVQLVLILSVDGCKCVPEPCPLEVTAEDYFETLFNMICFERDLVS